MKWHAYTGVVLNVQFRKLPASKPQEWMCI